MNQIKELHSFTTENSITLYWDKPEGLEGGVQYQVFLNRKQADTVDRTHCELEDLEPDTEYRLKVKTDSEKGRAVSDEIMVKTGKKKVLLDITRGPYHAVGDGKTLNTAVIQRAIDDCMDEEAVYLPKGVFLTGALRLHSDMELYLEEGAVLQGTDQVEDYLPRIWSRFEGIEQECYSSVLNLGSLEHQGDYNCRNVVIRGKGTIASGGRSLAEKVIASETEHLKDYLLSLGEQIRECEKPETIPGRVRPRLINMSNCQNITMSGLKLKDGASWNVHMIYSDGIVTNNCTFYSEGIWNGDGWDPDSSTNCTIFGCTFNTGDDSIAIKSGKNPEGNEISRPSEHIRIFDCKCAMGHGITIGSEMSGGINDVQIWDCDISRSRHGIEIKGTKKRGGYVKNVKVRDSRTARILFHSVGYNDDGAGAPKPPVFEKCIFENIDVTGMSLSKQREWIPCDAIELCGFDEEGYELREIEFKDIRLGRPGENRKHIITLQMCEGISFSNVSAAGFLKR